MGQTILAGNPVGRRVVVRAIGKGDNDPNLPAATIGGTVVTTRQLPRRNLVVAAALILVALVGAAWWLFSGSDAPPPSPLATAGARTAIIVPGYGGGTDGFGALTAALAAQGVTVEVLDIGDGHGDINAYAAQLRQRTGEVEPPVAWIGYSMGGVITRAAYGSAQVDLVSSVTTWSAPLHGTKAAALANFAGACDQACQQMTPDSELVGSISGPPAAGVRWLSLYSPADEVISPYTSSDADGARNIDLGSCTPPQNPTHGQMPDNEVVLRLTVANTVGAGTLSC